MNLRRSALRAMSIRHDKGRFEGRPMAVAASAALALALAGAGVGSALAATAPSAASAPDAASTSVVVTYVAGSQYTVRAGQSLNDVAIAVTQSHDRAVLARSTRALFDTNPAAFMNHDPSRLRIGAVLIVPALDASGALAASSADVAAGASGTSGAAVSAPATSASAPAAPVPTPAAAAAASTASVVDQANAAAASAASTAAYAAMPAASAISGTVSAPAGASAAMSTGAAAGGAAASVPVAGSQAAAAPASGTQEWTGSIQAAASAPAAQTQVSASGTTPAATATQAHPQVSSLQQLLALKNRVLMELQKHGIGGAPAVSGAAPTNAAQPVAGAPSVTVPAAPGQASVAPSPSNDGGMSQRDLSIAGAVGAALVVLLAALRMSRRKREKTAAERAAMATSARADDSLDDVAARGQTPAREALDVREDEATRRQAVERAAAEQAAAERVAVERAEAERAAAERAGAEQAEAERAAAERAAVERAEAERAAAEQAEAERAVAERAAGEQAEAERAAAERVAAEQTAAQRAAAEQATTERAAAEQSAAQPASQPDTTAPQHQATPDEPIGSTPASTEANASTELPAFPADETLSSAATAASLAAAAELGAEALPRGPLEPRTESASLDERADRLQWDREPARSSIESAPKTTPETTAASTTATPPAVPEHPASELSQNSSNVPLPVVDFTQHPAEPRAATPFGRPYSDTPAPAQAAPSAPSEFPRDAVNAFSSLDMPLPPRIEVPTGTSAGTGSAGAATPLPPHPVAPPETTSQQALGAHEAGDDAEHDTEHIAGPGAVAGLGAPGFGALKLDFDLELPPSPAQPLPAFTQADLSRIARNKLELASEYIELGDLAGARALINEVIEANDPATRTEARALLSTLAPLS
ncbi:FimV/HubP family polar landmark protein [Paraburkholderia susongensis]|uniref:FimV C-terminal domain-containing protein n=1 Tax=Paraburkholderia susongensis TaxID=1515439 RepID=A0A1X7M4Z2_9BURK|nr:FimV/HubP family polar landmark protein [Paraburkholderia susongensis]SMG60593.1 FimV C-terminal domain-containing protein [Paraburkholderia susongensis]